MVMEFNNYLGSFRKRATQGYRYTRASVRYSITGGNRDGLFTIDQHTGLITLAATLDYEIYDKHELVISGESGGQTVHTIVQVRVADVNDNPPTFIRQDLKVTVTEEDDRHLPVVLLKVEAEDKDELDYQGLLYTVRGDGVDGFKPSEAYFTINSLTGELIQQRALDRDPPWGKPIWKVRVQVRDGQALWSRPRNKRQVLASELVPSSSSKLRPNLDDVREGTSGRQDILNKRKKTKEDHQWKVWQKKIRKETREMSRHTSWQGEMSEVTWEGSFKEEQYFPKPIASHRLSEPFKALENIVVPDTGRIEDNIVIQLLHLSEIKGDDLPQAT
ncbi:protocadherin Fat 4-like [Palaemon carinicauda]|uniref:protocadherin Fat 4-like n=1 Tax=Palaemon carinicauda TaxID=392227 RepID=UPI0035B5BA92